MNSTKQQYQLACRIDRCWAHRRIDERTARQLLAALPPLVTHHAMSSFPAPAPTWKSVERWLRFMDIKRRRGPIMGLPYPRRSPLQRIQESA